MGEPGREVEDSFPGVRDTPLCVCECALKTYIAHGHLTKHKKSTESARRLRGELKILALPEDFKLTACDMLYKICIELVKIVNITKSTNITITLTHISFKKRELSWDGEPQANDLLNQSGRQHYGNAWGRSWWNKWFLPQKHILIILKDNHLCCVCVCL